MARVPEQRPAVVVGGSVFSSSTSTSEGITVELRTRSMGLQGLENGVTGSGSAGAVENRLGREGQGLKIALTTLDRPALDPRVVCRRRQVVVAIARTVGRAGPVGRPVGEDGAVAATRFIAARRSPWRGARAFHGSRTRTEGHPDRGGAGQAWSSEMAWRVADAWSRSRRPGLRDRRVAGRPWRAGGHAEQLLRDLRINRIFEVPPRSCTDRRPRGGRRAPGCGRRPCLGRRQPAGQGEGQRRRAVSTRSGCRTRRRQGTVPGSYGEFGPLAEHLRYVERSSRKLARQTFYAMARWQAKLDPSRAPRPDRRHRRRTVRHVGRLLPGRDDARRRSGAGRRASALADAFCEQARLRVDHLSSGCGEHRRHRRRLAGRVLDGGSRLEDGVVDQSEGTGPWIRSGRPDPVSTSRSTAPTAERADPMQSSGRGGSPWAIGEVEISCSASRPAFSGFSVRRHPAHQQSTPTPSVWSSSDEHDIRTLNLGGGTTSDRLIPGRPTPTGLASRSSTSRCRQSRSRGSGD